MIDIAGMTDERGLKFAARGVKMIIPSELTTAERLRSLKVKLVQLTMKSMQSHQWEWCHKVMWLTTS